MSLIKFGELSQIHASDIQTAESVLCDPAIDERFKKMAVSLKRIAPKADDFLYFSARMIHSAEAALINSDGSPRKTSRGEIATAYWEKKGEHWKWVCNDPNIRPYKNSNGDIFPEEEILKSHAGWRGKPLCVNHRSSDVDAVRGIILDTYYDRKSKGVIALCALDKVSFPELARGITTGYKTNFSMGTAVGLVCCSECDCVARVERDFCQHIKTKSGYGEVNRFLQPLELSVVTNGADPAAKLRSIIAAANTINAQLSSQEHSPKLAELENDLKLANEKLAELKEIIEQETTSSDVPYGQTGDLNPPSDEVDQTSTPMNIPERFASPTNNDALLKELQILRASIEQKLTSIETANNKEEPMSANDPMNKKEAYFQGGGGVNEPTPGQKKYPVDPMNEKLRSEDRHMVGQSPFPEVGPVDGMHPSPTSAEPKDELERKKMLARAERRAAALIKAKENLMSTKEAYIQGGGGVNEPTPGQKKYPVDPLNEKLRDKEDKQMVGQKPFPGVGDVDGLHPSPESVDEKDELERKKMLARASLKARFVRVANVDGTDNLGASGWQVYAKSNSGDKLVLTATVNEISGGNSDALFDVIATKEFGSKMLEKIRTVGLEKAASVYKKAQAVSAPGALPASPSDAGGPAAVPPMPDMNEPAPQDDGGKGDPQEVAMKLAEKVRDLSSDLLEAVKNLAGEQTQMGEMEEGLDSLPKAASSALRPLYTSRRELNEALISGMKKAVAELNEHGEELGLINSILDAGTSVNPEYTNTIVQDALVDAKAAVADGSSLMRGYIKYARGTIGLLKRAEEAEKASLLAIAEDAETTKTHEDENSVSDKTTETDTATTKTHDDDNSVADEGDLLSVDDENAHFDMEEELLLPEHDEDLEPEMEHEHEHSPEVDMNDVMMDVDPASLSGKKVEIKASIDLSTKEGRSAYRAKLAADATGKMDDGELQDASSIKFTDMLDKSNGLADGQTKLDVKPSDNLGLVETLEERNKRMLEVAKAPPKVRKEAERLNTLISQGKVAVADLDGLVAKGLDAEVVKYWKQYWGQAGKEGSEFGKLMTTETMKAKQAEEMNSFRVKVARAYELAHDMVSRGLLAGDRLAINSQVEEIMKWNDEGFESMKRVVAKHTPSSLRKEASIPQVGVIGESNHTPSLDFQSELDQAFANRKY